jgi:hypothetical protein
MSISTSSAAPCHEAGAHRLHIPDKNRVRVSRTGLMVTR